MPGQLVVFIHGWSARSTDAYGRLPERLLAEAATQGVALDVRHLYLGKYVSFRDEVKLEDVSRALEAALRGEPTLREALEAGRRLAMITHSTGGPVARDWWHRHYVATGRPCPLSHLVMLAPANFGSALAQLGKGTLSRLKSWFQGVEPGQGLLDWLELGSPESWQLNESWITQSPDWQAVGRVFPFVLTGQTIDRKLYDHVNSYTDEAGSDGVVRVASANLNAAYLRLEQNADLALTIAESRRAPRTALAVLPGLAHAGRDRGIMRSVELSDGDGRPPHPTVGAVLQCLAVDSEAGYTALCDEFARVTAATQDAERRVKVERLLLRDRFFENPPGTQIIVRVRDHAGHPLDDFDFLLTACDPDNRRRQLRRPDPDLLPEGFFIDRQRNRRARGTLCYYLDHEVISSVPALGALIRPRPAPGPGTGAAKGHFVHYAPGELAADAGGLGSHLGPNATLLLDIVLRRQLRAGTFRLTRDLKPKDFTREGPGEVVD